MRRKIINIDQGKCTGCGICISDCPEGALQVIDGKARLVGDLLCDGLGACLKSCPENAISVEEREAEPYNELKVLANIIPQGTNVLLAHLQHLKGHGQAEYLQQALSYLHDQGIAVNLPQAAGGMRPAAAHCPGSQAMSLPSQANFREDTLVRQSRLTHWPIQLHLISPSAPHYRNSDLLIAADCVAFTNAEFHKDFLNGRTLAIACPKLDSHQDVYVEKLTALIDQAKVRSILVMIMQVPCCGGLLRLVVEAARRASHQAPVTCLTMSLQGQVLSETPVETKPIIHEQMVRSNA
jgi:NAD-dependent dihydropyrimidine dehydrogenase PreA subunit